MEERLGKVTIAPQVLITIAKLTTLALPGVACMGPSLVGNLSRLVHRERLSQGINVTVEDNVVYIELYIVAEPDVNLLQLGHQIQHDVSRAMHYMLGMHVGEVNVHIQDVAVPPVQKQSEEEAE